MKKKIKLTESQLITFIHKTVKKVLSEQDRNVETLRNGEQVYTYPNDSRWSYTFNDGKWFASKNVKPYNWINIHDNPKYQKSIERLDKTFPNAHHVNQYSGVPTKNTMDYKDAKPPMKLSDLTSYDVTQPGDPNKQLGAKPTETHPPEPQVQPNQNKRETWFDRRSKDIVNKNNTDYVKPERKSWFNRQAQKIGDRSRNAIQ